MGSLNAYLDANTVACRMRIVVFTCSGQMPTPCPHRIECGSTGRQMTNAWQNADLVLIYQHRVWYYTTQLGLLSTK